MATSDTTTTIKCGLCGARLLVSSPIVCKMLCTGWAAMCQTCDGGLDNADALRTILMVNGNEVCRLYVSGTIQPPLELELTHGGDEVPQ